MALVIGMDEAGYGPKLGPLVVTVMVWEVPGDPFEVDFWTEMAEVVDRHRPTVPERLWVADSKEVYRASGGIKNLERSVLCTLNLCGLFPGSFRELRRLLSGGVVPADDSAPWLEGRDLPLPLAEHTEDWQQLTERWRACCSRSRIHPRRLLSDVVLTGRFNRLVEQYRSKGTLLSRISTELLAKVWDPNQTEPVLVVGDKHGGRNRYGQFLCDAFGGRLFFCQEESRRLSEYRLGRSTVRFETKAERHFPVALASMVSKYVRQAAMELFNRFWREHVPGLKPTEGYGADARRFKNDIAAAQARLGIPDETVWRER